MKHLRPFNALVIVALLLAGLTTPTFGQGPPPQGEPHPPAATPEPPPPPTKEPPPFSLGTATAESADAGITGGYGIMALWPGPDGYGYMGQTITYNWVDITSSGTSVSLGDDDWDGPFSIGFTFPFYGTNWTEFYIGSNGQISFGAGTSVYINGCPLPNAFPPENIIALMWDDLNPVYYNDLVYYESFGTCPIGSGACLVVQYENYHHWQWLGGGAIAGTFEAILFDNGDIIVQFEDAGAEEGSGSTTGIENANTAADYGLTYACNSSGSLSDNLAILFSSDLEYGWLEGHVMDSELLDIVPPCTDAVVHIEPGELDVPADPATGYYGLVALVSGTYTVTASAPGFSVETAVVDVTTDVTTTQDFNLWRPVIDVEPTNFISITAIISQETTYPLTITNDGHLPLNFHIREIPPISLLSVAEPRSYQQMPAAIGVDSFIYEQFAASPDGRADFFIAFEDTADLTPAYHMNWSDRGRFVVKALQAAADAAQGRVRAWLDEQGIGYTSYWINNTLLVYADEATLNALATLPKVSGFAGNHTYEVIPVEVEEEPQDQILTPSYAWNVQFPGADQVHNVFGLRGEGIVIGGMDTGVDYDHIGLVQNYRGCQDPPACTTFDHTYSWHNPGADECGGIPCDTDTHGTATHGIMAGGDDPSLPDGAWIGMAPNAQWIHCLGLPYGSGSGAELNECAQWMLAPGGDSDMRPHVVNHSWGSRSPNDCDSNWYAPALQAYRAADIFPAFAAGNEGDSVFPPHCWSSTSPANNTDAAGNPLAFASGAHGPDGSIDYYSSGGPSACNNDNLFPNLVAPGSGSCTTGLNDTYNCSFGGTSSASPHTAGCVALVRQAVPWLTVEEVEQILQDAADDVDDGCGQPGESPDWNNIYGEGHLDCYEAVEMVFPEDLPWVWEDPITGTIPGPGESEIDVTFHCTETHDYTGTLRILHNDPCEGPVDVPIVLHCLGPLPEPTWDKQVSINGVLTDTTPITVVPSDTVEIADRVWITYTSGITFTLVETWTESLDLDGWENDAGSVISGTNTLTWDVTDAAPNAWYAITKTFHIKEGAWLYDYITETLWVENADPQPGDRVLQFNYLSPLQRMYLPIMMKNATP